MTGRFNYVMALFLPVWLLLSACVKEEMEGGGVPAGERVALALQIAVDEGNGLLPQTKADAYLEKGELINSLTAFIVDEYGYIETVVPFSFTDAQKGLMATGDLDGCVSDKFLIYPGSYTIYAFANCDKLIEMAEVLTMKNGRLTAYLPETITWNGGADFQPGATTGFIPMSGTKGFTVSNQGGTVTVSLERLLSKIQLSFRNSTDQEVMVNSWKLDGFNTKINLFKQNAIQAMVNAWPIGQTYSPALSVTSKATVNVAEPTWFYVSESKSAGGFAMTLNASKTGGQDKTESTSRKELPRNSVWPIEILFSDYYLTLAVQGENPPIGGYPALTTQESLTNSLTCAIIGGGPFTLTPTLKATASEKTVPAVTWSIGTVSNSLVTGLTVSENTIVGRMAGSPIMGGEGNSTLISECTFTLTASSSGTTIASFDITLTFKDIFSNP